MTIVTPANEALVLLAQEVSRGLGKEVPKEIVAVWPFGPNYKIDRIDLSPPLRGPLNPRMLKSIGREPITTTKSGVYDELLDHAGKLIFLNREVPGTTEREWVLVDEKLNPRLVRHCATVRYAEVL